MLPEFVLGLDLAQSGDWSALVAVERHGGPPADPDADAYDLLHIERWQGESYAAVPDRVRRVAERLRLLAAERVYARRGAARPSDAAAEITLVVDATGVGAAVVDLLRQADLAPVPIVIHGGDAVGRDGHGGYRVPKRDLVSVLQVLLQGRRLRVAEGLPEAAILTRELAAFRVKITASGHDSYGAGGGDLEWRERPHDDIVLATALAAWYARWATPPRLTLDVLAYWGQGP